MTAFNTGTTAVLAGAAHTTPFTFTVPAGVAVGDVMIVALEIFTFTATTPGIGAPSSGGGAWTAIGPGLVDSGASGGLDSYASCWYRVATASDPGSTFTVSWSGSTPSTDQIWWTANLDSYTGFYTASPIGNVPVPAKNADTAGLPACPAGTTARPGSWAVYAATATVAGAGTISSTPPAGTTLRKNSSTNAGVCCATADTNGSAGGQGAAIGGGSFAASSTAWSVVWTIELCTVAPSAAVTAAPTPPRIPHPRFLDLLVEEAYQRADWQAQGVASLAQQHWRLMDGRNGRPGTGSTGTQPPATATSNGADITNGLSFYVTEGGKWFEGYWYYCCASGQSTSPAKFALWSTINSNSTGRVVPGSVVTSGTLTAGQWNYIPLPAPVQLGIWGVYVAAVGVPNGAGFPDTAGQFGSGQPYAAGIANGPLVAFSDLGAGNPSPGTFGQSATTAAGSDPAVNLPGGSAGHDNLWLDVQVTNTPPAGYGGSYRLWPNMADADFATAADASVNYVIGTEIIISQPVYVNAIWYYMPPGTAQFATSADIWRVRDGVRVATQQAPVWCKTGGGKASFTSGAGAGSAQWVYCTLPGPVYLAPGDYYVTVYDGNATPDGWGAKRLYYWESGNTPGNTHLTAAPGISGITSGPLYAPPTPLASPIQDFTTGQPEPGQSVFAVGPPNQFPNQYVGNGPGLGPALFQNYWVDLEATPAATWTPDAPVLPQPIPHPLFTRLLEVAAYRRESGQGVASSPAPPAPQPREVPSWPVIRAAYY